MSESDNTNPWKKISLEFGTAGHEEEYLLTVHEKPQSEAGEIPSGWGTKLQEKLGTNWRVMNRGYRIEIMPPNLVRNEERDKFLKSAIASLFEEAE